MSVNLDLEFAHAVLYVVDKAKMIDFYTDVLGFEVTDRGPLGPDDGPEIVFLSQTATHHHQIAFLDVRKDADRSNSLNHLAFRSSGSLDDLRTLHGVLENHAEVTDINPMTHGNAFSVYFADPEGNGVEVFIDSPWHVPQPQGKPIDLSMSDEELIATTEATFAAEVDLIPIGDFYEARQAHLSERA
jgi:catechol 2,3-dioxygenase